MPSASVDEQVTAVVDLTYLCNAHCVYCRWGTADTEGRVYRSLDDVLLPPQSLANLGTERVVFSGGEPRTHPNFKEIVAYYAKYVPHVVALSNAYGLRIERLAEYRHVGLTGLTISMDSLDPGIAVATRKTSRAQHAQVVELLERLGSRMPSFEVGLNVVVSSANCSVRDVEGLLRFAEAAKLEFVKFQPVFDDGFVSKHANHLKLRREHAPTLRQIGEMVGRYRTVSTNPPGFWRDLAALAEGTHLPGAACSLGGRVALAERGNVSMCYWVKESRLGGTGQVISVETIAARRERLEDIKPTCEVGAHCFCMQNMSHVWRGGT